MAKYRFTGALWKRPANYIRKNPKTVVAFLIFAFFFGIVTTPLMVLFGPFENVKKIIVSNSVESMHYQFIAKTFLTDLSIARITEYDIWTNPEEYTGTMSGVGQKDFSGINDPTITEYEVKGTGFEGKALIIADPKRVIVGYSESMPKAGQTTSAIARRFNAVAAINGGGFVDTVVYSGNGGEPDGFVFSNGEVVFTNIAEDDTVSVAAINYQGQLIVGYYSIAQLKAMPVPIREALNFNPPLIIDGVKQDPMYYGTAPRTAIGQRADGAIIFLVTEGRRLNKPGASNAQIQDVMLGLGAINACNLDGGSSSTMYYDGELITKVSDAMGERSVPTTFCVLPKAWEGR
jgi:exopolysaccharide biosynthesis protein